MSETGKRKRVVIKEMINLFHVETDTKIGLNE